MFVLRVRAAHTAVSAGRVHLGPRAHVRTGALRAAAGVDDGNDDDDDVGVDARVCTFGAPTGALGDDW